jgi:Tfp pilus assembly protein PilN
MHVNLFPSPFIARRLAWRVACLWTRILLVAVVGWLILQSPSFYQAYQAASRIRELKIAYGPLAAQEMQAKALLAETQRIEKRTRCLQQVVAPIHTASLLGVLAQACNSDRGPVLLQSLRVVTRKANAKAGANGNPTSSPTFLSQASLKGYTQGNPTVTQFMESLKGYGIFETLTLRSTSDRESGGKLLADFDLEFTYED